MNKTISSLLIFLTTQVSNSAEDNQPLPLGSTVLPEITFSVGEPNNTNQRLQNLRVTNFRDEEFSDQILLVMYHASW